MRSIFAAALSLSCISLSAATFTVTTNAPTGPGSLGQAIVSANASPGLDTIVFAIGSGPQTIALAGATFNPITDAVIIDGTTQPGFAGSPIIEIDGTGSLNAFAFLVASSGSTIKGLVINRVNGHGIDISGDNNTIQGNFLGTDISGAAARPNSAGVAIVSGSNNLIGGSSVAARNVISGNLGGGMTVGLVPPATANRIEGNYIGINAAGTAAVANGSVSGISLGFGAKNTAIVGNVVSGNATGISVGQAGTTGTTITGNFIGTNPTGTAAIANTSTGITVFLGATNTIIGGTTAAERNIISGNTSRGILISDATTTGAHINGNYIGVNAAGTAAIKNGTGIQISTTNGHSVVGNLVSGNSTGILISSGNSNVVTGNFIGTDVTGNVAIPNTAGGVSISGTANTIGGTTPAARNVISGNGFNGLSINSATGSVIAGNYIGLNAAGASALGNQIFGISINNSANTTVGGTTAEARNVISANMSAGIFIIGTSTGTTVQGNFIGTDAAGTANRGNVQDGVAVLTSGVQIGGSAPGAGNTIWFNSAGGVNVVSSTTTGVSISRNSINSNAGLGITFGGLVPNDPGDADTGPNNLQNFPVLTSAVLGGGTTTVTGTLNSTPSTTFTIELFDSPSCDPSGFGEGATFAASTNVTTDAMGNASFSVVVPFGMTVVTATATDPAGNTSEFSACAAPATLSINDVTVTEGTGGTTTATFTVTRTPAVATTSTVQYATANGTAIAPADYTAKSGTLTFNPGDATKTIAVNVVPDNIDESDETFVVNLSNAIGASIARAQGTGTIVDDDTSTISIADAPNTFEGSPAVFTVTLSTPSATSIVVNFSTADGTAVAGTNYTATSGTVTFAPGEVTKTISIPTLINPQVDQNKTFFVNITSTSTVTRSQAVGTIVDIANVPALSPWMLLLMAIALAAAGALILRR